jgi:predicted ATPase
MINLLHIAGFKSFASQDVPLNFITLLCGLNNSGKSSILQALRMYCNSAEGRDPIIHGYGGIDELRSKYVLPTQPVAIKCTFSNGETDILELRATDFLRPSQSPVTLFLSAERLGPRVSLPTASGYIERPSTGEYGEHVLEFLDSLRDCAIPDILHHPSSRGTTLEYEVAAWLSEISPGAEIYFEVDKKNDSSKLQFNSFRATNAGFGLSYSLPIIAAILGASTNSKDGTWNNQWDESWDAARKIRGTLLIIENPEAHLHPSAQTAIGRLIAKAGIAGLQIIVETQSEHIMDGVRLESRQHKEGYKRVNFNYLSRSSDGLSSIESPTLTESGKLSHWPVGFFDQSLKNKIQLAK